MRRVEQTQHIPVILLTGFGPDAEITSTAFRLGVADLVMKPVDPWTLRTKVRYLYDTHARSHALEREVRDLRARLRNNTAHDGDGSHDHHGDDDRLPAQRDGVKDRA
jgi:FixJ family two-component response regulator